MGGTLTRRDALKAAGLIYAQAHRQIPQVCAVVVSGAAGDRCVYRPGV